MKPNQIKKIKFKNGYYILTINSNEYSIDEYYYQHLLPYEGKVLEVSYMLELIAFSSASKALKKTYKKIFNHSICTYELKSILRKNEIIEEHIKLIIKRLKEDSYLKENDYVNHYKEIYQFKKGKNAFKKFLESKFINQELINNALEQFNENEDYIISYAESFIKNKVGSEALLKQKLYANLLNKGFSKSLINETIEKLEFKNEDVNLCKDAVKLIKKYPNDYYKVYNKLLAKGYKNTKIKEILKKEGFIYEN